MMTFPRDQRCEKRPIVLSRHVNESVQDPRDCSYLGRLRRIVRQGAQQLHVVGIRHVIDAQQCRGECALMVWNGVIVNDRAQRLSLDWSARVHEL